MESNMELDDPLQESPSLPRIENPVEANFDLYSFFSRYDGQTKLRRLLFVAQRCPNLQAEAYKRLIDELKRGINTGLYAKVCEDVKNCLGAEYAIDIAWLEGKEKEAAQRLERLEGELLSSKTTMVKESIRLGYSDIGDFHYERGNFNEALKAYVRTRDYCTMPRHNSEMCLNVINAALELNHNKHVVTYLNKADIPGIDSVDRAKIKAVTGLIALRESQYKTAAKSFFEVSGDLGGNYSTVIAAEDVALYGMICALATLDRAELRRNLLEKSNFKSFLELTPDIRALGHDFFAGAYGKCLAFLTGLRPMMLLDIYLASHADHLLGLITDRIIVQYFSPYAAVDMAKMSDALGMQLSELERKLALLISKDSISGRIDSGTKTLHRRRQDDRQVTVDKVLRLAEQHGNEVKRTILRLSLLQHGFVVSTKDGPVTSRSSLTSGSGPSQAGGHASLSVNSSTGQTLLSDSSNTMAVEDGGDRENAVNLGPEGGFSADDTALLQAVDDMGDRDEALRQSGEL